MTSASSRPPLWPFLVVDALFVGLAVLFWRQGHRPLLAWEACCLILCVAGGAWCFIIPFLRRSADAQTLLQAQKLADTVGKIQKLEQLSQHIGESTAQWQTIQNSAAQTARTAGDLAQNMAAEAKAFADFLQKANDTERAHLRLELEKFRRGETEWLQIVIRILDQVYALFQAASQSGQPKLAEQIGQFQNACRDIPRRLGVTPLTPQTGEAFDPKRHQLIGDAAAGEKAVVLDTAAPGYTYQGQIVRRALVRLQEAEPAKQGGEPE